MITRSLPCRSAQTPSIPSKQQSSNPAQEIRWSTAPSPNSPRLFSSESSGTHTPPNTVRPDSPLKASDTSKSTDLPSAQPRSSPNQYLAEINNYETTNRDVLKKLERLAMTTSDPFVQHCLTRSQHIAQTLITLQSMKEWTDDFRDLVPVSFQDVKTTLEKIKSELQHLTRRVTDKPTPSEPSRSEPFNIGKPVKSINEKIAYLEARLGELRKSRDEQIEHLNSLKQRLDTKTGNQYETSNISSEDVERSTNMLEGTLEKFSEIQKDLDSDRNKPTVQRVEDKIYELEEILSQAADPLYWLNKDNIDKNGKTYFHVIKIAIFQQLRKFYKSSSAQYSPRFLDAKYDNDRGSNRAIQNYPLNSPLDVPPASKPDIYKLICYSTELSGIALRQIEKNPKFSDHPAAQQLRKLADQIVGAKILLRDVPGDDTDILAIEHRKISALIQQQAKCLRKLKL